jgi:RNA polymerase-binding transcription factor DksA
MEIQKEAKTIKEKGEEWDTLLEMFPPNTQKNKCVNNLIKDRKIQEIEKSKTYKECVILKDQMIEIKKTAPQTAFQLLMELQTAIDDNELEKANDLIFNPDNSRNIMDTIADLIFVSNHSEIINPKKNMMKKKLTRAQILANAHDITNKEYGFCEKCNRPMLFSSIEKHQQETLICIEIKAGRHKTLELGKRKDPRIGSFIAKQTIIDDVSDDENDENDE